MTPQTEITQRNHHRAVRFFWGLLIGATSVSVIGNITHAVLPYIPPVVIQIGSAAVPPIVLLAAVHGIALAVRAGASGRVYCWAVAAVGAIGVGAFALSFLALRDLMLAIGYRSGTAWIFPAIIDTAVAVSTMMLVALGDKPARRTRTATAAAQVKGSAPTALSGVHGQAPVPVRQARRERPPPSVHLRLMCRCLHGATAERCPVHRVRGWSSSPRPRSGPSGRYPQPLWRHLHGRSRAVRPDRAAARVLTFPTACPCRPASGPPPLLPVHRVADPGIDGQCSPSHSRDEHW